ncbi:butyrate kinase [Roseobacter denitrificans]|uniref:Probable butyrate kinase n=1 Tax=Roseobacter denitrificans (strain ATCC 33942 / OCh 114) TaxID=375451 RepID=Q16BX9_ROSDO|nr:butyrate kinase [Roseobacter denitrificans]ABG30514.1 butyrate kinase [Roseobacter denitrificans OCh 114]AVL53667.1 butyrate kinase [Roseobacter denitrificans]SFF73660.1 butyrate kinase [Roseobacter denitrificans OCh 114]
MARNLILAINPGTTTTRCALYAVSSSQIRPVAEQNLDHDEAMMAQFANIASQLEYRATCVGDFIASEMQEGDQLVAAAGRGGMLTPVPAGVIAVNQALVDFALHTPVYHHASNLGAPLAHAIAQTHDVPAFIVDPVSVDELPPVARVTGDPDLPRFSFVHALNIRACGRRLAADIGKEFKDVRAVIAHLGAGFSIATLMGGKLVDSSNRMEISPFTPERAGGLPPLPLIELCYSQRYSKAELLSRLYGKGGVFAHLGTKDIRKVEAMVKAGDEKAALVYHAMLYQIAKAIGAMASVADFDLDAIILTGGLSNSDDVVDYLRRKLHRIADIVVYPGSNECLALAEGAARVLNKTEEPMTWPVRAVAT